MEDAGSQLLKLFNQSGFPLQLAVRKEVESSVGQHPWRISTEEHYWKHPETLEEGYIDLVLENSGNILRLVIECKRATGASWVFLTPSEFTKPSSRLSAVGASKTSEGRSVTGWCDLKFTPKSPEAAFCLVQGQDEKQRPMLERYASILLASTEAIASEDHSLVNSLSIGSAHLYAPVVLTTAKLYACDFDPASISLTDGLIKEDDVKFEQVPFVRFRKSLTTNFKRKARATTHAQVNSLNERTILIMNSSTLTESLKQISFESSGTEVFDQIQRLALQ